MPTKRLTKAPSPPAPPPAVTAVPRGKLGIMVPLLQRTNGATIEQLIAATGWQAHSVRGALAGALKKRGFVVTSEKTDGFRIYRLPQAAGVQP